MWAAQCESGLMGGEGPGAASGDLGGGWLVEVRVLVYGELPPLGPPPRTGPSARGGMLLLGKKHAQLGDVGSMCWSWTSRPTSVKFNPRIHVECTACWLRPDNAPFYLLKLYLYTSLHIWQIFSSYPKKASYLKAIFHKIILNQNRCLFFFYTVYFPTQPVNNTMASRF